MLTLPYSTRKGSFGCKGCCTIPHLSHVTFITMSRHDEITLSTPATHRNFIRPEKDVPPVTRLTTASCSSLFFGKPGRVDAPGGALRMRVTQSSHLMSSLFRTIVCRFGARSIINLINASCCSTGVNPNSCSSFSSKFFEPPKSISHRGLVLLPTA